MSEAQVASSTATRPAGRRGGYVLWKLAGPSPNLASVRYRALYPALGLRRAGLRSRFVATARLDVLAGARALVIVKSFTADDVALASFAKLSGIPVVFDLCDNVFVPGYRSGSQAVAPAEALAWIARLSDRIVVTSDPLRDAVRAHLRNAPPIEVVPDCAETIAEREAAIRHFHSQAIGDAIDADRIGRRAALRARVRAVLGGARRRLQDLRRSLQAAARAVVPSPRPADGGGPLVLWFGNSGSAYTVSGIADILLMAAALELAAGRHGARLLVVSDDRRRFAEIAARLRIPSEFLPWSLDATEAALRRASVAIVPNPLDPFALCKSANRTLLALSRGVPVVATPTPALEPLRGCVWLDDPVEGIDRLLADRAFAAACVRRGRAAWREQYSLAVLARSWRDLLDRLPGDPGRIGRTLAARPLLFVIGLAQDLDLVVPLLARWREAGHDALVVVAKDAVEKSPRVLRRLNDLDACHVVLPRKFEQPLAAPLVAACRAVFFASESSLGPHVFARRLCKLVRKAGRPTYTIQHGIECVGLTYSDEVHDARRISLLSGVIFLWGEAATLHPHAQDTVRARCVPVGCPKPAQANAAPVAALADWPGPRIGVFENLHWHRYDDRYRERFVALVLDAAARMPGTLFLVKPHHAGMWLTARRAGGLPALPNLQVADPSGPDWEPYTAPELLGHCSAVLTTPSTVALDAARARIPVAVAALGERFERYEPLAAVNDADGFDRFVSAALDPVARLDLLRLGDRYVERTILAGDAAARIVRRIEDDLHLDAATLARAT